MEITLALHQDQLLTIYRNYRGLPQFEAEFIENLRKFEEYDLNYHIDLESYVEEKMQPKFKGIAEKFDIREVVGKRENPNGDKTYSFLDKKYI